MREEQASRAIAARSVHARGEHHGVSKLHALTLCAGGCRDTPVRGMVQLQRDPREYLRIEERELEACEQN